MSLQISSNWILVSCLALAACSTVDSTSIPGQTASPTFTATSQGDGTTNYSPGTDPDANPASTGGTQQVRSRTATHDDGDSRATLFDPPGSVSRRGLFGRTGQADRPGVAYFLPRQLAKVTAKRSEIKLDEAFKKLGKAELEAASAKALVGATKAAIKETEDAIVAKGDIPAVRDLLLARLAAQKASLEKANKDSTEADTKRTDAESEAKKAAKGGNDGKEGQYKVAVGIELMSPSADPAHGFRLSPRHSAFRDDEHKLAVSPSGLLTSVDVIAADRTADALVEIATFAGAVSRFSGARSRRSGIAEDCPKDLPEEVTAIVDFASTDSVADLNGTLSCMGVRVKTAGGNSAGSPLEADVSAVRTVQGIVYRTPVDVLVRIEKCQLAGGKCKENQGWFPTQVLALSLPQAGPISHVTQNAGLFTKTTYGLVFKDGILINYNASRPSEVLEVARTPMRLVNGFFDGASKIISLRTGQNNALATEATSQVSLLQAQNKILTEALAGQKSLSEADLAALQSATALETVRKCLAEKSAKNEPTSACFAAK